MPKPVARNGRYMPGLDGLRAIAVLAVMAYHLNLGFAPGGLLGVGVFFVLSGYLISDILISEWKTSGTFRLSTFWLRRARRLLPALLAMLVVVVSWITLFHHGQFPSIRGDTIASFFYVSNWWFVFHQVSYFAKFGPPSPLGHLWSLGVEEQFYLLWPFVLMIGLRFLPRRGKLVGFILSMAAASAILMAVMYQPGSDPSRVYYGTDTRAFALLIGAALALIWPSRKLSVQISRRARRRLEIAGTLGLLVVLLMIWQTNEYQSFLYRGGLVLLSVAAAVVIASIAHPATYLSKLFSLKPLRWLGTRSYGLYLWHYPVIILTTPSVNTTGTNVTRVILQVAVSIAMAELSFRFVEDPIRHGGLGKLWNHLRTNGIQRHEFVRMLWLSSTVALVVGVLIGTSQLVPTATATSSLVGNSTQVKAGSPKTTKSEVHSAPPTPATVTSVYSRHGSSTLHAQGASKVNSNGTVVPGSQMSVTAIGDSVMVDATPYLKKLIPGIVTDGHVGMQMYQAPAEVAKLKSEGKLGEDVVIELGTNGPFTKNQLISLLRSLGNVHQIILVNTRVPRPWQNVVNATLKQVADTFPHTTLVNWYAASAGQNGFFYPDGVHLNPTGAKFYAKMVAKVIE